MAQAIQTAETSGSYPSLNRDSTISGVDANSNGVRDDIDSYIATLPDSGTQKAALVQASASIGNAMKVSTSDTSAISSALSEIANAAACLHARYDTSTANEKNALMEQLTVNTKTRFDAYAAFSSAASGMTFALPQGDGCAQ